MLIGRCKDRGFQTMSSPRAEMRSSSHGSIRRISTGVHLCEETMEKSAKPWLIAVDLIARMDAAHAQSQGDWALAKSMAAFPSVEFSRRPRGRSGAFGY